MDLSDEEKNLHDIVEQPAFIDERLTRYKGVYNRMGQNMVGDQFGDVKEGTKVFDQDLFNKIYLEDIDMESEKSKIQRKTDYIKEVL